MVIGLKQVAILNGFYECFFSLQSLLLFLGMQCYTLIFMDFLGAYLYTRCGHTGFSLASKRKQLIKICLE